MKRAEAFHLSAESPAGLPMQAALAAAANLPPVETAEGHYLVRFARTAEEIDAALKLRFEVFNLELGEGLDTSHQTGRDIDEFDTVCHHLIVVDTNDNQVVGTYRCQTAEMAAAKGFYSAGEFDFSCLPAEVSSNAVELGRACVAQSHRNTQVLFLLWKGLAAYAAHQGKRYLFGCCSLTSQDEREGVQVFEMLKANGHIHPALCVPPLKAFECHADALTLEPIAVKLPKLFQIYLRFGARVCGPPAIDRQFKTIDFLVLFDIEEMDAQWRGIFFGASTGKP